MIRPANRLVQGRNQIVMVLPPLCRKEEVFFVGVFQGRTLPPPLQSSQGELRRYLPSPSERWMRKAFSLSLRDNCPLFSSYLLRRELSAASVRGFTSKVLMRERRAGARTKEGFSVVAPKRTRVPFSTSGKRKSCWGSSEAMDLVNEEERSRLKERSLLNFFNDTSHVARSLRNTTQFIKSPRQKALA